MFETTECYGLFTRLLGLTFAFQLASTGYQLLPLIGRNGVEPIKYLISRYMYQNMEDEEAALEARLAEIRAKKARAA